MSREDDPFKFVYLTLSCSSRMICGRLFAGLSTLIMYTPGWISSVIYNA
jgi:hypothetical protein